MRLVVTSLLLSACVASPAEDDVNLTPSPVASGAYQVTSTVQITIEALLPEPAANLVGILRDFSTNPGQTLFDAAESAGVPAVGTLRAALPDVLENRLEGWINAEVATMSVDGTPVTQYAATIVAYAETSLSTVAIESELTVAGGEATHRLTTLDLTPAGLDIQLALGALPSDIIRTTAPAVTAKGRLTIGDHLFAVSYGAYAWQALEAKTTAETGAGIRATLGAAVNCPLVAARVAAKCMLGVCVGHTPELIEICERGLDEVVDLARTKLAAFRFDALHFEAGTATVGATGLGGGVWNAEINAGQGLRHVPAIFSATR